MSDRHLRLVDAVPSNAPLREALRHATKDDFSDLFGHVIVRRDGRVIAVEDSREDDWLDFLAQLDEEEAAEQAELAAIRARRQ